MLRNFLLIHCAFFHFEKPLTGILKKCKQQSSEMILSMRELIRGAANASRNPA